MALRINLGGSNRNNGHSPKRKGIVSSLFGMVGSLLGEVIKKVLVFVLVIIILLTILYNFKPDLFYLFLSFM